MRTSALVAFPLATLAAVAQAAPTTESESSLVRRGCSPDSVNRCRQDCDGGDSNCWDACVERYCPCNNPRIC
ncbi:hypothetical protein BDZ88DRAFT_416576 [Geranomyces variabilis]|nr:hypothetical protein BDZ88DRAFT_416576 [Geranomyces variabilis]